MSFFVYFTNDFVNPVAHQLNPQWHVVHKNELASADKTKIRALATTVWDKIDSEFLAQFPNLQFISHLGIGTDNIDKEYLQGHGIRLVSQPQAGIHDTAELAFTLMLTLARRIIPNHYYAQNNQWPEKAPRFIGNHLFKKNLGLVGIGQIGSKIASFAEAFGMNISYTARNKRPVSYVYYDEVTQLALNSDYLVICCAGGPQTHHLVDHEVLSCLGAAGYLINVSRGSVIDEQALIHALKNKTIAGAGLDVFMNEPEIPAELRSLDNVVLSPHMGSSTHENLANMFSVQARELNDYLYGESAENPGLLAKSH